MNLFDNMKEEPKMTDTSSRPQARIMTAYLSKDGCMFPSLPEALKCDLEAVLAEAMNVGLSSVRASLVQDEMVTAETMMATIGVNREDLENVYTPDGPVLIADGFAHSPKLRKVLFDLMKEWST